MLNVVALMLDDPQELAKGHRKPDEMQVSIFFRQLRKQFQDFVAISFQLSNELFSAPCPPFRYSQGILCVGVWLQGRVDQRLALGHGNKDSLNQLVVAAGQVSKDVSASPAVDLR